MVAEASTEALISSSSTSNNSISTFNTDKVTDARDTGDEHRVIVVLQVLHRLSGYTMPPQNPNALALVISTQGFAPVHRANVTHVHLATDAAEHTSRILCCRETSTAYVDMLECFAMLAASRQLFRTACNGPRFDDTGRWAHRLCKADAATPISVSARQYAGDYIIL